jgi:hypothetical protein
MNIQRWGDLSLGEWSAICRTWNKAHRVGPPPPPTEAEFDKAVMISRGIH